MSNQNGLTVQGVENMMFWGFGDYPWRSQFEEIKQRAQTLSADGEQWLSVHHHHRAPGMRYMMPKLLEMRRNLEERGCQLVLATLFREPKDRHSRSISLGMIRHQ
jgi:hypothetical protein